MVKMFISKMTNCVNLCRALVFFALLIPACMMAIAEDSEGIQAAFLDDFSNPASGWRNNSENYDYLENEYEIKVSQTNHVYWAWAPIKISGDYILQVDMRVVDDFAGGEYGLVFNRTEGDKGEVIYMFFIKPHVRGYCLKKLSNRYWSNVVPFTQNCSYINLDRKVNRLKVAREGESLQLYVNDHLLKKVKCKDSSSNTLAGICASSGDEPIHVRFDNFEYDIPGGN